MAISIPSSNYSGEHAGQYLAAALKSAKSFEYLTILENIKFKRNITKVSSTGLIVDQSCNFADTGTISLEERVLTPKNLEINTDICKSTLLSEWQAAQMRAGAHNSGMSDDFAAFVVGYLADTIADHIELNIWRGNSTASGEFVGFMHPTDGHFENDATIVESDNTGGAGTAFDSTNIDNNLDTLTLAIPSAVYAKDDLYIYMSTASYRLYLHNQANAGYQQLYNMGDGFAPMFNGIKIAVCPGMVDNK